MYVSVGWTISVVVAVVCWLQPWWCHRRTPRKKSPTQLCGLERIIRRNPTSEPYWFQARQHIRIKKKKTKIITQQQQTVNYLILSGSGSGSGCIENWTHGIFLLGATFFHSQIIKIKILSKRKFSLWESRWIQKCHCICVEQLLMTCFI